MLSENLIVVKFNDLHHGLSEVMQIPWADLLTVVLGEHHRIVHFASVINFVKLLRRLNIKRLNHDFCASSFLVAAHLTPLFLLCVTVRILSLMRTTTC